MWLPRSPAFSELHPSDAQWVALESSEALNLQEWAGLEGQVLGLKSREGTRPGYFLLESDKKVFLKLIDVKYLSSQLKANQIAEYLFKKGIFTSLLLEGFPKSVADNQILLAYEYIEAKFVTPSVERLVYLGRAIGQMHNALLSAPFADDVSFSGQSTFLSYQQSLENIQLQKRYWNEGVEDILANYSVEDLNVLIEGAQCTHGDLNVGNLLLTPNNEIVFLDFESSFNAWYSPLKDLAFVVERFVLTQNLDLIPMHLNAILTGYQSAGQAAFRNAQHLVDILKALSVRSLIVLSEMASNDLNPLESEWKKFVMLFNLANQSHEVLASVMDKTPNSIE